MSKKIEITEEFKCLVGPKILEFRSQGFNAFEIANKLNITRNMVRRFYADIGLANTRPPSKKKTEKYCKMCSQILPISEFRERKRKTYTTTQPMCRVCEKKYNKQKVIENPESTRASIKKYRSSEKGKNTSHKREKERLKTDPQFMIKKRVSHMIRLALHNNSSNKNGSTFKFLPYTPEQLEQYLESKFEWWMTWKNHGVYNKKIWKKNNSTTWTWQIDHIIPQSDFHYKTMDCQEFRDCWALKNLRPYPAKQNQHDGSTKIRHRKKA